MPAPIRYVQDSANFPESADVVVIGAGIAGSAATWELAKQGLKVVVVEKGLVGAEQSSRNWGWCRQQNRDERELPLIIYALQRWGELNAETGEELGFRRSGLVYATRKEEEIAAWDKWGQMAKQYGVRSDILSAEQAKTMTPGSTTHWLGGVSSPSDGHAEPRLASAGLVIAAQRLGALVFQQCAVRGLDIAAGAVSGVWTERGLIKTCRVICAAGVWSSMFCRRHGIDLPLGNVIGTAFRTQPIEQAIAMPLYTPDFACRPQIDGSYTVSVSGRGRLEPGAQGIRYARQFYPTFKSRRKNLKFNFGIKPFFDGPEALGGWEFDRQSPFERVRILDPAADASLVQEGLAAMRKEYPALANLKLAQAWGGMIDSTPDAIPVISTVAKLPGLVLSAGFSAHGFGIGPGAGRLAADLATDSTPVVDPTPYRYSRLVDGSGLSAPGMM
ncbi:NAD(P)/FAD-dependent oxidoreductase [Pluralibacter gergoviae]|uniref:NAD(P)/FAD-dependent oxidoreductase n=1 Tax=Pluralibacter gergoviae TaxID=61647 RepID=UPI0008DC0C41|nr:FAD-binding oxidoreductase [Pluralibacter gergoviae]EKW6617609.1 FAD-binding oxidoreductase [Pluralibacter gergoviae]OHY69484.1 D-amino-acid oxidase [Pluralibacter gergoviae]